MALPVQMFPALTQEQISPVATGIGVANQLYSQGVQNNFLQANMQAALRKQQLANQLAQSQVNISPQMNAAQLAYAQAKVPNLNAATAYLLNGQIPQAQAQAGYLGTETAKNDFLLNNPATLLPGMPGQIGALATLRNLGLLSDGKSPPASAPTQDQNFVNGLANGVPMRLPGMPSAGAATDNTQNTNAPLLPQNTYGTPGNPAAGVTTSGLPTFQDATNMLVQSMMAQPAAQIAKAKYYQQQASGFSYKNMPKDAKSYAIAQLAGMGIEPSQGSQYLSNGGTITDAAIKMGIDPNNLPTPIYAATPQTVQLIQRRNQALNEINSIMPNITNAIAPYARQFAGYSPSQIAGAIKNDNPDQQARFLASKALMPEMASLRLKAMGGNIGIEAIKEVNNQSMGNIKSFQGLVSPQVYSSAQNYVDQWINQGANAANKVGLSGSAGNLNGANPSISTAPTSSSQPSSSSTQMVTVIAPSGMKVNIPSANLAAALKRGARQV